jgi:uncharacterized protein YjgD (DUF1641 family)
MFSAFHSEKKLKNETIIKQLINKTRIDELAFNKVRSEQSTAVAVGVKMFLKIIYNFASIC